MPPSGANIIPALPGNHHVPPSPRSDASGTTDQSRGESEKSVDRVMSRMSQISLAPHVSLDVIISRLCLTDFSFHGSLIRIDRFPSEEVGIKDILLDLQDRLKVLVPLPRQIHQQLD